MQFGFQQWPMGFSISINFSNLALANRVSNGQASSGNNISQTALRRGR
jgi:hypothetical protein